MAVLLLNASYEPLTVVSWKRAVTLVVTGQAEMVEQQGDRILRSAGGAEFPFPHVVRLMQMVSWPGMRSVRSPRFSKANLNARDAHSCQVKGCRERGSTIDHVTPRSRGGETSWENCVLMCHAHNSRKGDQSLEQLGWALKRRPMAPAAALVFTTNRYPEWDRWMLAA